MIAVWQSLCSPVAGDRALLNVVDLCPVNITILGYVGKLSVYHVFLRDRADCNDFSKSSNKVSWI